MHSLVCPGKRAAAPVLVLALVAACLLSLPALAFAAPAGLTVALQKDAVDAPIYAVVSWTPDAGATSYEIQKAYIRSQTQERAWATVTLAPAAGADGRLTARDSYDVGSGAVCYRVRTLAPVESEFTSEACSPIPPTTAPGAPDTGNVPLAQSGSEQPPVLGAALVLAGLGMFGLWLTRMQA
jgi:hypothetical protein